jgi:hypothetical protein
VWARSGSSAFAGKQPPLRSIDSTVVPVYFALRCWQMLSSIFILVIERSVDAVCIPLKDRTLPHRPQNNSSLIVSAASCDKVFYKFDVLAKRRKDGRELVVSYLKNTERCVLCSINDLYVFQS